MRHRILIAGAVAAAVVVAARFVQPSNHRDWSVDQAVLPSAEVAPPLVTIRNIRNFDYQDTSRYTPAYYDKTFDLRKLDSAWFVVEPFDQPGAAHTFVSFGFGDSDYVAISIEIRKEKGESFSALKGLLRRYELMYVIGDERDLIRLRTNYRKDQVYLYRIDAPKAKIEEMFLAMVTRANALREKPEFYNTLTNTCTTNLVRHVNQISAERVPRSFAVLLPANSDKLAYDIGLIDRTFTFDETKARAWINDKAEKADDDPQFSRRIRE
ncbi:MAG TPA: DUF4105 domain-containing protein [Thermoanaerobaculia bacterium]